MSRLDRYRERLSGNMSYRHTDGFGIGCTLISLALFILSFAAWVTHVMTCIAAQAWIMLAIGGILAPIGVIHGIMIWFGAGAV